MCIHQLVHFSNKEGDSCQTGVFRGFVEVLEESLCGHGIHVIPCCRQLTKQLSSLCFFAYLRAPSTAMSNDFSRHSDGVC